MAALHSGYQTLFQLSISASETTPEFTGFKQNRYFLKIVQSELDSAGHFFWSHLGSFVPLQTCKDSSGTGHQRRFHSHVWYLGWSGWNSWGTVGNLCLGSLSGRVAGPFSMTARGSTREEAEACRPQENCNGTTVQASASACSRPKGKHPPSASSDKECMAHLQHTPGPSRGAARLTASQQRW